MNVIKPKKKVLHIVGKSSYDGTCIFAYRLAEKLTEYDSTFLFVQKGSADGEFKNLKKIYLSDSKEKKNIITYIISVFLFFIKNKFNVVHYQSGGRVVLFISFLLKKNAQYVHHFQCGNLTCSPNKTTPDLFDIFLFRLIKINSFQIAVSNHVAKQYKKFIGNFKNLETISNTVPFEFEKKEKVNYTIGYIGQINKLKNFDLFQNCINAIACKYPQIKLVVKGDNYSKIDFTNMAVEYISPSLDVDSFYKSVDIILFPSNAAFEGLPLVILEAIAKDTPVISMRISAVTELLEDYPFYVNYFSPEEVVNKVNWFYSNQKNRNEITQLHKSIHLRYSYSKMVKNISTLYTKDQ